MSDIITGAIVGFIGALSVGIIILLLERKLKKSDRRKERLVYLLRRHKKKIVDDVFKKLYQLDIKRDDFTIWKDSFNIWIEGLDELKKQRIYEPAIEHLKAYPDINDMWIDSNKKVKDLNIELKNLRKHISDESSNKLGEDSIKILRSPIWCVIEGLFSKKTIKEKKEVKKFLDDITIRPEGRPISVDYKDKNLITFFCGYLDVKKIKKFMLDLFHRDTEFREKVAEIIINSKKVERLFKEDFKTNLKKLLQDLKGMEEELKWECDRCSSWIKEIDQLSKY